MQPSTISLPSFLVIGIAVRTTNTGDQSTKDIGEIWSRFMRDGLVAQIPDKVSDDVYGLYLDYDNGANGHYTAIVGCKVHSLDKLPDGFMGKKIPALTYHRYISKGKIPDAIMKTWRDIWASGIPRTFKVDFDLYGPKASNMEDAEVETYVSC